MIKLPDEGHKCYDGNLEQPWFEGYPDLAQPIILCSHQN